MEQPTTPWRSLMPKPDFIVLGDFALEAAELLIAGLSAIVDQRGVASLVLAGGSTPLALYRQFASPRFAADLPWANVHFFWGDERLVPPDDPGSNFAAAQETLLNALPIPAGNIHRLRGELPPDEAVADYTRRLRVWAAEHDPGAPHPWPRFDLVLLGMGEDGHTASLFPGSPVVAGAPVLAVTAGYQGRPAGRVTLTPLVFNDARRVIFLVAGENKAGAVHDTFHIDDPIRFPAQRIRGAGDDAPLWLLDKGAARPLKRDG